MAITLSHLSGVLKGKIYLTSSKSESNRALIIQALQGEDFNVSNLSISDDTKVLQELLSSGQKELSAGLAGTVMRFLTAFLAIQKGEYVLTGESRMKERPIKVLVEALQGLGANILYKENKGYPPLHIFGKELSGGKLVIDGGVSSQYISALLMIAPKLNEGLILEFEGEIISKPYINMTIEMMRYFGVKVDWNGKAIVVDPGNYQAKKFVVEADWSAASYWYSMVALAKEADVTLFGLKEDSLQGDAVVKDIYAALGVKTEFVKGGVRLIKNSEFSIQNSELTIDFVNCPDIAQTVAVTCAALNVKAKLVGLKTLRIKETDRISAIQKELKKLGFSVDVSEDDLLINAISHVPIVFERSVKTYDDHRMAMAFAPLCLLGNITIEGENVVTKSYPSFWEDAKGLGVAF